MRNHSAGSHPSERDGFVQVELLLIKERRYDEIRNLYVEQLAYMSVEDLTEATRTRIEKKIESLADGDLEHAAETVSALWGSVKGDGDLKAPLSTLSPVSLGLHFTDECSSHLVRLLVSIVPPTGTL